MIDTLENDKQRLQFLADEIGTILEKHQADNAEVIGVCMHIAVRVADAMGMQKAMFMLNADLIYDVISVNYRRDRGVTLQ